MQELLYITLNVYLILSSILVIVVLVFLGITFYRFNSLLEEFRRLANNLADTSGIIKEKIEFSNIISVIKLIIKKYTRKGKDKDE